MNLVDIKLHFDIIHFISNSLELPLLLSGLTIMWIPPQGGKKMHLTMWWINVKAPKMTVNEFDGQANKVNFWSLVRWMRQSEVTSGKSDDWRDWKQDDSTDVSIFTQATNNHLSSHWGTISGKFIKQLPLATKVRNWYVVAWTRRAEAQLCSAMCKQGFS